MSQQCKAEKRAINILSVQRPQPHNITQRKKEEKGKTAEDKKGSWQ